MEFLNPKYLTEAFDILDKRGSELKVCAGMTHLLRFYTQFPKGLESRYKGVLHIGDLDALSECREEYKRYVVGSTTRIAGLEKDAYLARFAPAILDAAEATSTPQIRNRRTVGGEVGWGSYHSPLIVTLMALEASVRVRFRAEGSRGGFEDTIELAEFYDGEAERIAEDGTKLITRKAKSGGQNLIMKIVLPEESLHRTGNFNFFKALAPKISTENSGVVLAVSGVAHNGVIQSAQMVASGLWLWTLKARLPLEGVKMNDLYIYEKLYSFCDRYSFDKYRREGPSGNQLGLVMFGLLKEGFTNLLGR
jgi:CO/xanthine dehydrogenase FAD-binding subunit